MFKRRITVSISLALSLLLTLLSLPSTAQGQPRRRPVADTGIITLGQNQVLRITVRVSDTNAEDTTVRFRRQGFNAVFADGSVRKYIVASQDTSAPITLMPGEGASIDIPRSFLGEDYLSVRGVVLSSSPNVQVNALIVDTTTGNATAIIAILIGM